MSGLIGSLAISTALDALKAHDRDPSLIDAWMARRISSGLLDEFSHEHRVLLSAYEKSYAGTGLWHGSGRYQYDSSNNSKVVDVFERICADGTLLPRTDRFDVLRGPMDSISLAHSRMYARSYADTHSNPTQDSFRYGSSGFWATYFASRIPLDTVHELAKGAADYKTVARTKASNIYPWGAKVNSKFIVAPEGAKTLNGIFTPFYVGSDIEGNYPILFALGSVVSDTGISSDMYRHEVRTENPIDLSSVRFIEVPFNNVEHSREVLVAHGLEIPVVPMEVAEAYCARLPFSELVYPETSKVRS